MVKPEELRERRILALKRFIFETCGGKTTLNEVYRFCYHNWGYSLRRATFDSYIMALIERGEIKINDDHVIAIKKEGENEEVG
ncbi:MAG: hypothetical protein QXO00_02615 [Candidatus Bathyarchaeia archaeon]